MTPTPPSTERLRRLQSAPVGLLLLGWGLGVGPLAHAVLAHGEPLLHEGSDRSWVQHPNRGRTQPAEQETAPAHRHAPGGLEHLQLAISAVAVPLTVAAVLLQVPSRELAGWRAPMLQRWRRPEVPGAP